MAKNGNLHNAKKEKNDEFYTQLTDIEKEMKHYKDHFKDKVIFCNCDDPEWSNFWRFFSLQFERLGLKRLISTHFEREKPSYMLEMWKDDNGEIHTDRKELQQNGDFRSPECVELLKQADIVVTNPPFSLFREYVAQLMEYGKKFIIVGNKNSITYKEFFPLLKDNKVWIGYQNIPQFLQPDGTFKKFGNVGWFTNLDIKKRHEELIIFRKYSDDPSKYPKYDNYDAINVDKVSDIPCDYDGVMGVPITFLDKFNPEQFEIIKCSAYSSQIHSGCGSLYIKGKKVYARILIRKRTIVSKLIPLYFKPTEYIETYKTRFSSLAQLEYFLKNEANSLLTEGKPVFIECNLNDENERNSIFNKYGWNEYIDSFGLYWKKEEI